MATALAHEQCDSIPEADSGARIGVAKAQLGKSRVILGHHNQRDEVFRVKAPPAEARAARVALNRVFEAWL